MSNAIIRRIDFLGRVVIPIHIRKAMSLKEEDMVEIEANGNEVVIRKYNTLKGKGATLQSVADSLSEVLSSAVLITDSENIIVQSKIKREDVDIGSGISVDLYKLIDSKTSSNGEISLTQQSQEKYECYVYIVNPVKPIGTLIILKKELSFIEVEIAKAYCNLIGRLIENKNAD